jgi:hypothetical protein
MKYMMLAIWVSALSLGAAYATLMMDQKTDEQAKTKNSEELLVEQVQTKRLSIPIIGDGRVKGYVLAQFVFHLDGRIVKELKVRPDSFLVDEAFKIIFANEAINFKTMTKPDSSALVAAIKNSINSRFGENFLREVLVQELTYIPQERFRGG